MKHVFSCPNYFQLHISFYIKQPWNMTIDIKCAFIDDDDYYKDKMDMDCIEKCKEGK